MRRLLPVGVLLVIVGAVPLAGQSAAPDLRTAKVVDLTHPFDRDTIYWPTSPSAFELKTLAYGQTPGGWFYRSNALCTPEHGGTHLDAPIHFAKGGLTADQIPRPPARLARPP